MSTVTLTANQLLGFPFATRDSTAVFSDQVFPRQTLAESVGPSRSAVETAFNSNIEFVNTNQAIARSAIEKARKDQLLTSILTQLSAIQAIGDGWNEEGLRGPNAHSIEVSTDLAHQFVENDFSPAIVTQTVEEGICFVFKNNILFLYLEIYNDGEIGVITEDFKHRKIVTNTPVTTKSEVIREINHFLYK